MMQSMHFQPRKRTSLLLRQECDDNTDSSEKRGYLSSSSSSSASSKQKRISFMNTATIRHQLQQIQFQQQSKFSLTFKLLLKFVLLTTATTTTLFQVFLHSRGLFTMQLRRARTAAAATTTNTSRRMTRTREVVFSLEPKPVYGHHTRIVTLLDHADTVSVLASTGVLIMQESSYNSTTAPHRKVRGMRSSNSDSDDPDKPFSFEKGDCKAQHAWQKQSYMTCNSIHERDLTRPFIILSSSAHSKNSNSNRTTLANDVIQPPIIQKYKKDAYALKLIANGSWRDVWIIHDDIDTTHVMKTLRYDNAFTEDTLARQRIDALIMERLTASPYVMNIYGHCGMSGFVQYAPGAIDIASTLWPGIDEDDTLDGDLQPTSMNNLTKLELLQIGVQASMGLAALHNFDVEGVPSVAHTDISPNQFVKVDNFFRLNDFNRARLLTKNIQTQELCTYCEGTNRGKNRSPEEYAYEPQTAMVDIYSLGNIFYMLLMQNYPFRDVPSWKKVGELIQQGERPHVFPEVWNSTNPVDQVLKQAMVMCHAQEPENRATARQVETYLQQELERLDPGRLESWGVVVDTTQTREIQ